jgi:hypothetical protein
MFYGKAGMEGLIWRDPARVLVGTFAGRQPKPFGAFLTQKRHSNLGYLIRDRAAIQPSIAR